MINLRKARINKDLSREELAKLVGCSKYMIDSLESGRVKGSIETLKKVLKVIWLLNTLELTLFHSQAHS